MPRDETRTAGTLDLGGDLAVGRLGFGATRLCGPGVWGELEDPARAGRVLRRAVDLGVDFIDTADAYGPGVSERGISSALHPYPANLVIATKGGYTRQGPGRWRTNGRPKHLREACEGSLRRLKLDRIDLYQLHRPDSRVPFERSIEALAQLREEGKIRHVGLSNVTVAQLEIATGIVPIVSVQNRYNLNDRRSEAVLRACERAGIAFIPWLPLATGRLARPGGTLHETATRHGATVPQVALAWLLAKSPAMLPIPGTSSVEHLEENIAAARLRLSDGELRTFTSLKSQNERAAYNLVSHLLERIGLRHDEGYAGGVRVPALLLVALLITVLGGCGGPTGGTGSEGENPRPIETGGSEETENSASGDGTATGSETTGEGRPTSTRVEVSTLATDLRVPWSFAFLPNGDALVTERDSGRLLRVSPSGDVREVQTLPEGGAGEGGLLGIAVSPEYERDRYVYAYTTTEMDNRVVRFRLGEEPEPVLTGIPVNSYHNGGRIEFGPDGMLYVTTGDAGDTANSQDRGSLGGKILRVAPDGSTPADNPFPNSPVYSYGHRNVQGLAWDARGQLFASEFGQNTWDEANRIEAGENYGWPEVEGEGGTEQGFVDPITVWPTSEASPSGAEILVDGAIPRWEGDLFVTALRGESLWRLELGDRGNVTDRQRLLEGEVGRVRDVAQAPDGSLWVSTSNRDGRGTPAENDDRIFRLAPEGE